MMTLAINVHATDVLLFYFLLSRAVNAFVIWLARQFIATHNETPQERVNPPHRDTTFKT